MTHELTKSTGAGKWTIPENVATRVSRHCFLEERIVSTLAHPPPPATVLDHPPSRVSIVYWCAFSVLAR